MLGTGRTLLGDVARVTFWTAVYGVDVFDRLVRARHDLVRARRAWRRAPKRERLEHAG